MVDHLKWTDETVASFWAGFHELHPGSHFSAKVAGNIILRTKKFIPKGGAVCDYGFAGGELMRRLVARYQVTGIEFTQTSIDRANHEIDSANFVGARLIDHIAELHGRFDAVFFIETLEHLLPHHIDSTLANLHALLKPGGIVACTTPHRENLRAGMVYCPITKQAFHKFQHVSSWTVPEVRALFERTGFQTITATHCTMKAHLLKRILEPVRRALGWQGASILYIGRKA